MAMGLPVICTNHPNQKSIVKEGLFINMSQAETLAQVLSIENRGSLKCFIEKGLAIAREHYDLQILKHQYIEHYQRISASAPQLPTYSLSKKLMAHLRNTLRQITA
jgi:glycosyltransferase involved in cell wall biosynthesis